MAATSYIIEVGTASGQTDLATIPVGNVTTFSGSGPALTYFLAVRAVTGFLQGPRSNELMFSLPGSGAGGACTVAPTAPAGLSFTVNGNTVSLAWGASGGCAATSYVLEAGSFAGGTDVAVFDTGSAAAGHIQQNVLSGTYFVRVKGKNDAPGTSGPSNEVIIVVP